MTALESLTLGPQPVLAFRHVVEHRVHGNEGTLQKTIESAERQAQLHGSFSLTPRISAARPSWRKKDMSNLHLMGARVLQSEPE